MAGTLTGFDGEGFRTAIRSVFAMAAPVDPGDRATFYFRGTSTSAGPAAADGVPFNPSGAETHVDDRAPVTVPCGVQYVDAIDQITNLGVLTPTSVVITMFDAEYALVEGCDWVMIGGVRFSYMHTETPRALFDVGIARLHFLAVDQK